MCASHKSCDEWFDCSHPDLNKLQQACLKGGAVGSRLTGAGWGGCVISLVPNEHVDNFFSVVLREYYSTLPNLPAVQSSYLFATHPAAGARKVLLK